MEIETGLAYFDIELPTSKDLETLSCYVLTSDYPWDPTSVDETNWVNVKRGKYDKKNEFVKEVADRLGT